MKDFSDCYKAYSVTSEATYAESSLHVMNCVENIMFGYYHPKGGTTGEMSMTWQVLGKDLVPYLKCYDDAFEALSTFKNVINAIAELDNKNMTPMQFREILDHCGFKDETERGPRVVEGSITTMLPGKQMLLSMPE